MTKVSKCVILCCYKIKNQTVSTLSWREDKSDIKQSFEASLHILGSFSFIKVLFKKRDLEIGKSSLQGGIYIKNSFRREIAMKKLIVAIIVVIATMNLFAGEDMCFTYAKSMKGEGTAMQKVSRCREVVYDDCIQYAKFAKSDDFMKKCKEVHYFEADEELVASAK